MGAAADADAAATAPHNLHFHVRHFLWCAQLRNDEDEDEDDEDDDNNNMINREPYGKLKWRRQSHTDLKRPTRPTDRPTLELKYELCEWINRSFGKDCR